ncbi:MAG TPA: C45 family peptidase, partial [Caldimonas sp.]
HAPECLDEMRGLADGSGVSMGDILALNARSEIMFAAPAADRASASAVCECTSFAVLPEASASGHTLVGQNWDWLPFARETAVVLEVHRHDRPGYVAIAEAGHLAKVGFNSAGLGVCTNTLVSSMDHGKPGVPYHVVLRALLDTETISAATQLVYALPRAFSANYLLAHADGFAVNIETTSGGASGVAATLPVDGVIAHSNHFVSEEFARTDARVAQHPHSLFRLDAMRRGLAAARPSVTLDHVKATLRSHRNKPDGICSHPNPAIGRLEQRTTVVSVVADLDSGELWMTPGPPCDLTYRHFSYAACFAAPERVAAMS